MASSTSSPWKPAPSPCSLPSRAPPAAMAELLFSPAVPLRAGSTKVSAPFLPWRAWSRPLRPAPLRPPAPVLGVLLPPPADLHLPAPWPPSSSSSTPPLCPAFFPGAELHSFLAARHGQFPAVADHGCPTAGDFLPSAPPSEHPNSAPPCSIFVVPAPSSAHSEPLLAVLCGTRRLFVKMCSKPHAAGSLFREAR